MAVDAVETTTFGATLRTARINAGFHTIRACADALSHDGIILDEDTLGRYENDQRKPQRDKFLLLCAWLAKHNGLRDLRDINRLLWLLGWRNLDEAEIEQHFSTLVSTKNLENLPPSPLHDRLVGRDDWLKTLMAALRDPSGKRVIVVSGLGGIGKTALVYEVVRRIMRDDVFDQLAWESLKSEEFIGVERRQRGAQSLEMPAILGRIARQLGLTIPPDTPVETLRAILKSHLREGRKLIVVDNLESLDAVRVVAEDLYRLVDPTASSQPCRVLITSRERLVEEPYAVDHFLTGLSEDATYDLLKIEAITRELPATRQLSDTQKKRIYTVTGGMPLAIKLLVSQQALGIAIDEALQRLEEAVDEEELYRFIYFDLWDKLNVDAQLVVSAAASFGHATNRDLLLSTSQLQTAKFNTAIRELVRMALIEIALYPEMHLQRYNIHPMTRWFVNAPLTELWFKQKGESDTTGG